MKKASVATGQRSRTLNMLRDEIARCTKAHHKNSLLIGGQSIEDFAGAFCDMFGDHLGTTPLARAEKALVKAALEENAAWEVYQTCSDGQPALTAARNYEVTRRAYRRAAARVLREREKRDAD